MIQRVWGSFAVAALVSMAALSGCGGDGGKPAVDALAFVDPTDGATLGASDDLDAAAAGVQYNVRVMVTNTVDADTLSLRVGNEAATTIELTGAEDGAERTFLGATLPLGDQTLTLELVGDGEVVDSVAIEVSVTDEATGETPTVAFSEPSDGATLTVADDTDATIDGLQLDVVLELGNVPVGTPAQLEINGGAPLEVQTDRDSATFGDVTLPEGSVLLHATVTIDGTDYEAEATVTVELTVPPEPSLTIVAPDEGAAFTTGDDADPDAPGFQLDVSAETDAIADGTEVQLSLNGAPTATGAVEDAQVLFEAVTLAEGETTIRIVAQVDGNAVEDSVTVTVAPSGCAVTLLPPPPAEGCAVTQAGGDVDEETPGVQLAFSVETTCSFVELVVNDEVVTGSTVTDGAVSFDAITVEDGVTRVQVNGRDGDLTGASPVYEYEVDVTEPTVSVTSPTDGQIVHPGLDTDGETEGIQFVVSGASDVASGGEVAVTIDGILAATATAGEDGSWSAPVTFGTAGALVVAAGAIDPCGNPGAAAPAAVTVYVEAPVVAIVTPAADSIFGIVHDLDPSTAGLQIEVGLSSDLPDGIEVGVECRLGGDASYTGLGGAQLVSGAATVAITLPEGASVCRAAVTEPLIVVGSDVAWRVDLTAPTATITTPADGAILGSRDIGLEVVFGAIAPGEVLEGAVRAGDGAFDGLSIVDGAASATVSVPDDGSWTLSVVVTDEAGNAGNASITVSVDTVAVELGEVFPVSDAALTESDIENRLDGLTLAGEVLLGAVTGTTQVCVSANGGAPACAATDANGSFLLPAVIVIPGANALTVTATDAAGNRSELTIPFTLDVELPRMVITAPADATSTRNATVQVTATSDLPAGAPASVYVNGAEAGSATAAAGGALSFAAVPLALGSNVIRVDGTDARGTGQSAPVTVTRDVDSPAVRFVRPTDGALLGGDAVDASPAPGIQYLVEIEVTDNDALEDAVTLTVTCSGGSAQSRSGTTVGGTVSFDDITLPTSGSCTFEATATDAAGNTGSAVAVVGVDLVPPTIAWQQPLDGDSLLATVDVSADAGMQANLRVRVDGSAIGQRVTVVVEQTGMVVGTYESAALTAANQSVTLSAVPVPEGPITLRATVSDAAGNAAAPAVANVTVASDLSGLFVSSPGSGSTLNAASDVGSGSAGLQYNVTANVFGPFSGLDAHLCLESADAGLAPCGRAGYRSVAVATIVGNAVAWPAVTLPEGLVRLTGEIELGDGALVSGRNVVSATVDSVRPTLATFTLPGDTDDDGIVSASEDTAPGGLADVAARLTFGGLEDGRTVTVRSSVPAAGTVVGTGTVSGGEALVALSLAQGTQTLTASATDVAGNSLEATALVVNVTVDTVAPTLAIVAPTNGATLRVVDDLDAAPGLQFAVSVTSNAGSGRDVTIEAFDGSATAIGLIPLAGTAGTEIFTLPEGSYTLRATATDAAGNTTQVSIPIVVDSVAPSVTVTTPGFGSAIAVTIGDDASAAPGLQVPVEFTATSSELGDAVVVRSSLLAGPIATTTRTTLGMQQVLVTLPTAGTHQITVEVTDEVGNVGSGDGGDYAATFASCGIALTTPTAPVTGTIATDDGNAANGFGVAFAFTTVDAGCNGATASLVHEPAGGGPLQVVTTTTVASGSGSFGTVAVPDGTDGFFYVEIDQAGDISQSGSVSVIVDLTAPVITGVVPGGSSPNLLGLDDASGFGPGTVDLSVAFTESNGDTLEVYVDGDLVTTVPATSSPALLPGFALTAGTRTLDFVLIDELGNESTVRTEVYVVDWTAPASTSFTVTLTNVRNGVGTLSFTGTTGDATSYEARYATSPIVDEAGWLAATSLGTAPATDGAMSFAFGPLALFQQTYHFALQAVDAVGNTSAYTSGTAQTGLRFRDIATPLTSATWTAYLRDVNGDGFDDWAVGGGISGSPRVVIAYGSSDITTGTVQTLTAPAGASTFWGATIYAVGDVNGDGYDDVVLPDALSSAGFLHLGGAAGIDQTPGHRIQYTGGASNFFGANLHQGMGDVLDAAGDATDDGIDDIVLAAPFESTAPGARVLVLAGRTTWPPLLDVSTDAAANALSDVATLTHSFTNSQFGYRTVVVPDVDGDGMDELAVSARNTGIAGTYGGLYYFAGGTICAAGCDYGPTARAHTAADAGPWTGNRSNSFWGTEGVTGTEDLDGDGLADLLVADVLDIAFDVVLGAAPMPAAISYASTITGYAADTYRVGGNIAMLGDVRLNYLAPGGDVPYSDLGVAIRNAPGAPSYNDVVLFLNDTSGGFANTPTSAFSLGLGGVLPTGGGDANGDGFRDLALFLPNAGGGTFRLCY